jgi:hypothetical protein
VGGLAGPLPNRLDDRGIDAQSVGDGARLAVLVEREATDRVEVACG